MDFLETLLNKESIRLDDVQKRQFQRYYELLIEWNEKMNLTAITEEKEVMIKHFFDSLTPGFYFPMRDVRTICDVGSGAGFPGIPLKIMFPELSLTIVDSLQKRLVFLQEVVDRLELHNVTLCHDRAENFAHNKEFREQFDLVTARAVARLSVLSEYCLPLVRLGGIFLALKGSHVEEEVQLAQPAIKLLGGKLVRLVSLDLPEDSGKRTLVRIDKIALTKKSYPRKAGIPAKKPL